MMINEKIFEILDVKPLEVFTLSGRLPDNNLYRITDNFTLQEQSAFDGLWIDSAYPTFSDILTGKFYIDKRLPTIKVGDTVTVVNSGKTYMTYADWFKEQNCGNLVAKYAYGHLPIVHNCWYKVIAKGKHVANSNLILYAIEDTENYGEIYLIAESGIERVEDD